MTLNYSVKEAWIDFCVYEWMYKDDNGFCYELKNGNSSNDVTYDLEKAQTLFCGTIKWDACSHVTFGDNDGYIHLCGKYSWKNLQEAMTRVFKIAGVELSKEHNSEYFKYEA